ncbi:MAG: hypothetical protein PHY08_14225 [Candidatus Cloacimonetes bacterium]|nr:hypothetical protein [Candidatus Cloacimonadota bacterium]
MKYYTTGKKGFYKEWWKSGIKNWYYALVDMIAFTILINVVNKDLSEYPVNLIVLVIFFFAYTSIFLSGVFIEHVLDDMLDKDYFTNDKNLKNHYKLVDLGDYDDNN